MPASAGDFKASKKGQYMTGYGRLLKPCVCDPGRMTMASILPHRPFLASVQLVWRQCQGTAPGSGE